MRRSVTTLFAFILLCLTSNSNTFIEDVTCYNTVSGLSSAPVIWGVQDDDGLLWFLTWNGLNCYDGYDFHWVKIKPGDGSSITSDHLRDIRLSPNRSIYCRTDKSICEFSLDDYTFKKLSKSRQDSLRPLMNKQWNGLTDRQGNRWYADKKSLYKVVRRHHPSRIIPGTAGERPRSFMLDKEGRLWIGFRNTSQIKIYTPGDTVPETMSLSSNPYVIFQRRNNDIWTGCKPGALIKDNSPSLITDAVYDLKEDSHGRLWIATFGNGIRCCLRPDEATPQVSASLGGSKVRQLLITPSDRLIAATTDGLMIGKINSSDCLATKLRPIRRDSYNSSSLASDALMALARDSRGNIFIATESSGIDMISEENLFGDKPEFVHFNKHNSALTDDVCKSMTLVADTMLIIVGNDNVTAFNPTNGTSVNYGKEFWTDSCQFTEATPLVLPDGSWILGAEQGALHATAHNLYTRGYIPPIVYTTLAINGGNDEFCLAHRDSIKLDADERNVSIGFAAIDFVDNNGIFYRTRVDGSPWTNSGHNHNITLFNLSPGEHTLEVQSTDRYGRWVNNNRKLTISVDYYWHETWWAEMTFILLTLIATGATVYTFIYIRRINRQRRELLDKYMALIDSDRSKTNLTGIEEMSVSDTQQTSRPESSPFLTRVRCYIEDNIDNPDANIDDMAAAAAASRSTLNRHLKSQIGITAAQLLIEARLQRAEQLLRERPELSISEIAQMCGYTDPQYFQRMFKSKRGYTIASWRSSAGTKGPS